MAYRTRGYTAEDRERDEMDRRQLQAAKAAHLDHQIAAYRTPRALRWGPMDYEASAREILAFNAGERLPTEPHPLTTQRLQSRSQWHVLDLARDILAASHGDHVLALDERQIHAAAIASHVISDLYADTANARVLRRQPRLLDKVIRWTRPLEISNYLPTTAATIELEGGIGTPSIHPQEWQTVQPVAAHEAVALAMVPIRLRFTEQMIVDDDVNAVTAILDAVVNSAAQAELNAAFSVLNTAGNLSDGESLFIASNTVEGQSKNAAAIDAGIAKLRAQNLNGQAADIEPDILLCPAADEATVRTIVHNLGGDGWITVIGTSYLTAGAWYLAGDPEVWASVTRATMAGSNGASLRFQAGALVGSEGARDATIGGFHAYRYQAVSRTGLVKIEVS